MPFIEIKLLESRAEDDEVAARGFDAEVTP